MPFVNGEYDGLADQWLAQLALVIDEAVVQHVAEFASPEGRRSPIGVLQRNAQGHLSVGIGCGCVDEHLRIDDDQRLPSSMNASISSDVSHTPFALSFALNSAAASNAWWELR